ncbi:hypothetical protein AgCh_027815 [Apium graveolens]
MTSTPDPGVEDVTVGISATVCVAGVVPVAAPHHFPMPRRLFCGSQGRVPVPSVSGSSEVVVFRPDVINGDPRREGSELEVKSAKKPSTVMQSAQTSETKVMMKSHNKEPKKQLCEYWITGNCVYGDRCKNLHSWYYGDGFTMLAKLEGHTKAVTWVALPSSSEMLYSVSKDKFMRVWNCHTGQECSVVKLSTLVMNVEV